jgi:hypothetical protein
VLVVELLVVGVVVMLLVLLGRGPLLVLPEARGAAVAEVQHLFDLIVTMS